MEAAAQSTEVWILGWSAVLLLVQVLVQATAGADLGPKYLVSPRDEELKSKSLVARRLDRALQNLLETYPAFIALVVALVVTGKTGGIAATGAWLWIIGRVIYVPLYAAGTPVVRTLFWMLSMLGLVLMAARMLVT